MVPQPQYSDELRSCKDRFLIQCVPTEAASVGDLTSDIFIGNNRQDVKLHVSVAPPLALRSVLEGEIRAFAAQQGVEGHRQCLRKFLELLLARGVLSQSQVLLAFGVVAELFNGVRDSPAEPMDVTRADGVAKWVSRGPPGSSPSPRRNVSAASLGEGATTGQSGMASPVTLSPRGIPASEASPTQRGYVSPREHVFQPAPDAKPLFPSAYPGSGWAPKTVSTGYLPAGRVTPSPSLSRTGSAGESKLLGRGRTESGSSAVSESGSGVLEPPPTPEGSSLASIQAASALYSSSLNDRIAPSFKGTFDEKRKPRGQFKHVQSRPLTEDSDGEDFQDASEMLPDPAPSAKLA
ncbi:g4605 [Coccomyxa elongata]